MKSYSYEVWAVMLFLCVLAICVTAVILSQHPYVVRFEMDDNSLKAVQSINYTAISAQKASPLECWTAPDGCNRCCGDRNGTHSCTLAMCVRGVQ